MPAITLNHYRNSIGYIYGVYQVGFPNQRPAIRARVSGTGFLVGDGLLATNHHVAEPWYGDPEARSPDSPRSFATDREPGRLFSRLADARNAFFRLSLENFRPRHPAR